MAGYGHLKGQYPESYNTDRYRKRYDAFKPAQMHEAWANSGQPVPVAPQDVYDQPMSTVGAGAPPAAEAAPQFQAPANPYPPLSPEHRAFREMEALGDTMGIQRLLQQSPVQPQGLFGVGQ